MRFEDKLDKGSERLFAAQNSEEKVAGSERGAQQFPVTSGKPIVSRQALLSLQRTVGNAQTAMLAEQNAKEDGHSHENHDHKDNSGASSIAQSITTPGTPLESKTRLSMEKELGGNFGNVRLHVDQKAAESVQAAAFTMGNDIVVHPQHFSPGTPQAQRTLAHELTHVKQQSAGPVSGSMHPTGVNVSDPSDKFEREAEAKADTAMMNIQREEEGYSGSR